MSNPYTELSKIMEQRGAALNGYNLEVAKVLSIKPLTIRIGFSSIQAKKISALKSILNTIKINPGDYVVVQRVMDNFYILSKVVGV